jgi:hypothetical protein
MRELEEWVAADKALGGEENEPKILSTEERELAALEELAAEEEERELAELEEWDAEEEALGGEANEPKTVNQFVNQFQNIEDSSPVLNHNNILLNFNKNLSNIAPTQTIQDSTSTKQDAQKKNPQTVNTKCCTIF